MNTLKYFGFIIIGNMAIAIPFGKQIVGDIGYIGYVILLIVTSMLFGFIYMHLFENDFDLLKENFKLNIKVFNYEKQS